MLQINYNIEMPQTCAVCPLYDEEFYYCHGRINYSTWEVQDIVRHEKDRPNWCPLQEIKKDEQ